jgi:membrane associated rhomboid family serine protease
MFPIGDDNRRRTVPVVTFTLIALNVLVFLVELSGGDPFIVRWAFVPSRFAANPIGDAPTILSSMFMHAGMAPPGWQHAVFVDLR